MWANFSSFGLYFDLNQNFEKFNAIFEDVLQNHHFTTQKNDMGGEDR